jgi:hypothetical protein
MHHAVGERAIAADPAAEEPGHHAARQVDGDRARVPPGQRLGGVADQRGLVAGVQHVAGVVVQHDHVVAERQHDAAGPAAGAHVLLQQVVAPAAAGCEHGLIDLIGGRLDQRDQHRVGVLAPAGQVDHADGLAGERVVDGDACAGEALEVLGIVLMAEDVRRAAGLQGGADAVGADAFLGVAEAGREHDAVKVAFQVDVGGQPGQDQPGAVGQDDADRLAVELLVQLAQHRIGAAGKRGLQVGISKIAQVDVIGGDLPLAGAPP